MNDPIRLLASPETTDLERQLLASWNDERPTTSARDKTFALLGVTSGAVAAGGIVSASVAPKALAAGWLASAKWIVVSVVTLGALGAGVAIALHKSADAPQPSAPIAQTLVAPPITHASAPQPVAQPTTNASPVQARGAPLKAAPVAPAASLADQVAALDRARAALEAGDARGARKLADAYESEYPSGAFTQEADVVRIEALVSEGSHDAADRAAKRFLAAYPKSPHVARVRALLGYDP